jgi:hypothetical protein
MNAKLVKLLAAAALTSSLPTTRPVPPKTVPARKPVRAQLAAAWRPTGLWERVKLALDAPLPETDRTYSGHDKKPRRAR